MFEDPRRLPSLVRPDQRDYAISRPVGGCASRVNRHWGIPARTPRRVSRLGRPQELPGESSLSRARAGPALLDVHSISPWALHAHDVAHAGLGLRALGYEPLRISP